MKKKLCSLPRKPAIGEFVSHPGDTTIDMQAETKGLTLSPFKLALKQEFRASILFSVAETLECVLFVAFLLPIQHI